VIGQQRGALVELVGMALLGGTRHRGVHLRPARAELRAVGNLLRQRMLEGVLDLRIERRLVDELASAQGIERRGEPGGRERAALIRRHHRGENGPGKLFADHRRGLQRALLVIAETVDARGEHRLHRGRNLHRFNRANEAIGTGCAGQAAAFQQRLHDLFDEERVAAGAPVHVCRQALHRWVGSQQIGEHLPGRLRPERQQRDLLIVRRAHPVGLVFGAEVHQPERAGVLYGGDRVGQEGVAAGIDPLQVVEEENRRLARAARLSWAQDGQRIADVLASGDYHARRERRNAVRSGPSVSQNQKLRTAWPEMLPAIPQSAEETKSAPGWRTGRSSDASEAFGESPPARTQPAVLYADSVRGRSAA
jgi:hypothetical protein